MSTDQSNPPFPPPSSIPTNLPTSPAPGTRVARPPVSEPPSSSSRVRKSRRRSIPIAFPPLFQPNASSTSLVPSTAEGRPIPLDDSTAADRDSALRELNSHYPSRHRYAKSTGAQSTTYSQPVIVRTYPGPPSRPVSASRGGNVIGIGIGGGRPAPSATSGASAVVRRIIPFSSAGQQPGMLSIARAKQKMRGQGGADELGTRLPPVEAFTFKSFMANLEAEEGSHNINQDLDRIAEICARSRYSLSNQYEVHKTPHGSGDSFLDSASSPRNQPPLGPTLQAVSSDDERNMARRRRRGGGRRRSIAVGTLETIMSSSRSSDEDKSKKKKSAAEIADEVRGRAAARKESGNSSPVSSQSEDDSLQEEERKLARKKSASFATAVIENTRHHDNPADAASPRSSANALLSDPALPQTSTSHLEVRPAPEEVDHVPRPASESRHTPAPRRTPMFETESRSQGSGLLSSLTGWIPWRFDEARGQSSGAKSEAEGSLRELLKTQDGKPNDKGKGVDRSG